jgi:hypothetical protein
LRPTNIAVQWQSGRVERYATNFGLAPACRLVRALSDSSPSITRAWLEDETGALLYVAIDGRGQTARRTGLECAFRPIR